MRLILAALAFAVMIPAAQADDDDNGTSSGTTGPICIQSIEGPTICITPTQE